MPQTANDNLVIDLGVLSAEPEHEYHAKAGEYLSSHQLKDFINCPKLYRDKQLGLIRETVTPDMLVGSATHALVLEGRDAYESRFALGGPINKTSGKPFGEDTKAFAAWCAEQGKPGIHHKHLDVIEDLYQGVMNHDEAMLLLQYGRSEGVIRTAYRGISCQARYDWIHPHRGIIDLKTTADLDRFEHQCKKNRYHNQIAFYRAILAQVTGQLVPVYLVAVEKKQPFRCGVWRVSEDTLAAAQRENDEAIIRLKECQRIDYWPTGYEVIRILDFT